MLSKIITILRPRVFWYYLKQFLLHIKYKEHILIKHYSLMIDRGVSLNFKGSGILKLGRKVCLRRGCEIDIYNGAVVELGDNFFMNRNSTIVARYGITIGGNCMIGDSVAVYDHDHLFRAGETPFIKQGFIGTSIHIGDNVWIGRGVFIGEGVRIGDNVVIGAGSIITKNIPSNSIVHSKNELVIRPLSSA